MPNGVDSAIFHPATPPFPLRTKKKFKFLFLGGAIKRKGFDLLMQAYTEEFSAMDDVSLVVKDYGGGGGVYRLESEGSRFVQAAHMNSTGPEVEYLTANMEQSELAGLYTATDLLVQPFRGEGFGMPISEMMASGGCVMVPDYGAAIDFVTPDAGYLVPSRETELPQNDAGDGKQSVPLVANAFVGIVDLQALKRMMRHAVTHPDEVKAKGLRAREEMRHWSWDHAAEIAKGRLQALMQSPQRRKNNRCMIKTASGNCEQAPSNY